MKRTLTVMLVASFGIASGAGAQEAIPTAANQPDGGAPVAASSDGPLMISHKSMRDDRGPLPVGPCGGVARSVDGGPPKPDRNPHGAVWGGVGTHGYRDVGGAVCIPIGDNSRIAIAVDSTSWGRR
jgi:hypothetical protein